MTINEEMSVAWAVMGPPRRRLDVLPPKEDRSDRILKGEVR
jgi:hypothetical protein